MVHKDYVVIEGIKEDGNRLRPSDWIERLSSSLASFGTDNRLRYDTCVQPCVVEGQKCLVVARDLSEKNPGAYEFIMGFARSNQLRLQLDRRLDERALQVQPL